MFQMNFETIKEYVPASLMYQGNSQKWAEVCRKQLSITSLCDALTKHYECIGLAERFRFQEFLQVKLCFYSS